MKYFSIETNVTEKAAKGTVNKVMINDAARIVSDKIDSSFKQVTAVNTKDSDFLGAGEENLTTITEEGGTETTERYEDIENFR